MNAMIAIPIGLILSVYGELIGRQLWRIDSHFGTAWRTERDYVAGLRWGGAMVFAGGLVGWACMSA